MSPSDRLWSLRFGLITLAAVVGIAVTASLGFWQLGRAETKLALQAAREAQEAASSLTADTLGQTIDAGTGSVHSDALHRRIVLRGEWLAAHTRFLDNRQMQGRPGFFVVTPLKAEGLEQPVLVQRGWVPRNFQDRTALPVIDTPSGVVIIEGRVAGLPSKLYEMAGGPAQEGASRIRQNLDLETFRSETGLSPLALSVVQTGQPSEGLLREWPAAATGVDKHYGYAFQWFGLSALIALLYVWFQLVRRFIRPRRDPAA